MHLFRLPANDNTQSNASIGENILIPRKWNLLPRHTESNNQSPWVSQRLNKSAFFANINQWSHENRFTSCCPVIFRIGTGLVDIRQP